MRWFFLLIGMLVMGVLHSAPIGNTATPKLIRKGLLVTSRRSTDFRAGYEGDFVTDGRMEQFDQGSGRVDSYRQETNSGTLTLNILERLDLYGIFGSSRTKADWRFSEGESIHRVKLKTNLSFLWACGARAILYEWCNLSFGVGGRYSAANYQPTKVTSDGASVSSVGTHLHWHEWQINADFSYQIQYFTPYIGAKYLSAKTRLGNFSVPMAEDGTGSNSFKGRNPVGFYLGCAVSNGQYCMLNLEGRLIDEEAFTVSIDFKF